MKIFHNNLNNNSKTINAAAGAAARQRIVRNNVKYLPSFSKEWKNIIYCYNKNNLKDIPVNNININNIIKSYFNLYFKHPNYLDYDYNPLKKNTTQIGLDISELDYENTRKFLRRIYVSNAEIKHTNNKAIITLYTVNREKKILKDKYLKINKKVSRHLIKRSIFLHNKIYRRILAILNLGGLKNKYQYITKLESISKKNFWNYKLNDLTKFIKFKNTYLKKIWSIIINNYWKKYLNLLRKYDLLYSLNQSKFNKQIFLYKLSKILNKIIGKEIQYNIVNLKSIAFHSDLLTNALVLKIQKTNMNYKKIMSSLLNRAPFPLNNRACSRQITKIQNTSPYKDFALISIACAYPISSSLYPEVLLQGSRDNPEGLKAGLIKYRSGISASCVNKTIPAIASAHMRASMVDQEKNIDKMLGNSCNISQVHKTIFNSIGYKNLGGMRLEVKGRLSKRYRADRSLFALKWKGGLKNVDSSFKGLSSVLFRGNTKSNVSYSMFNSKRRIGAFAVKGWISGKSYSTKA
uniref:Ribosomal protein S3 n=1 Tax=Hirsutella thompsonii TaxID=42368 RepID=A0A3G2ZP31_HIRTH|nr:ribosomal protein S3 [Hirsutella thompsonii]AYP41262.1 ribosomal protein S3 [Hirsutella thompsonii]AYP41292.1 ribosomal protein S3 [Hirsutella thompsonii]AYP41321.1 ribosomal protein S3 [Hirsutella thompsonii]